MTHRTLTDAEQYEEGIRQAGRGKADELDPLTVWLMGSEWARKRLNARPEGAEAVAVRLFQAGAAVGVEMTEEQRDALADHLAAMHVRVVAEEDPR